MQHGLRNAVGRQFARVGDAAAGVVGDDGGGVVVHALEVQRRGDRLQVPGLGGQGDPVDLLHVRGKAAAVDGVQPPAVDVAVVARGGLDVLGPAGGGLAGVHHVDDADAGARRAGTDGLHAQAVPEQQVVGHGHRDIDVSQARRVPALEIADPGRAARLVDRDPVFDPVPEDPGHQRGVVGEPFSGLPRRPAAPVLQGLRQVPVVKRREGSDARLQQRVHEPVVEGEARPVDRPVAVRDDPRPRDREAVGIDAEVLHDPDVPGPAMVEVARDVAGVPAAGFARSVGEGVSDRRGPAVLAGRPFDLVRRGRYAPGEASW